MKEFALSAIKSVRNIYFMLFLVVSGMYHTGLYSWNTSSVVVKKSIPMKGIILRLYLREFHCNQYTPMSTLAFTTAKRFNSYCIKYCLILFAGVMITLAGTVVSVMNEVIIPYFPVCC